jgi:hypothetical protein
MSGNGIAAVRRRRLALGFLPSDRSEEMGTVPFLRPVRAELTDAWWPRNALEQQLIDQLAQWQILLWQWQETVRGYMLLVSPSPPSPSLNASKEPPRVSVAKAMDQAEAMVERCHRLYLRTLGALQDLRRRPPVVVRRAGQVNIGQQQVNVAGP